MGKSTVLHIMKEAGLHVFSADVMVHDLLLTPSVIKQVKNLLGPEVISKHSAVEILDHKAIAECIFTDAKKRKGLEAILHPEVLNLIKTTTARLYKKNPQAIVVYEVPLLFEAGYADIFDTKIVVFTTKKTALSRLLKKKFTERDFNIRTRTQMPITAKKKLADYCIDNNGDLFSTKRRVNRVLKRLNLL